MSENLKLFVHKGLVPLTINKFPAGESLVRIQSNGGYPDQRLFGMISLDFRDNGDLINLMMLVDAVRREFTQGIDLALNMHYLPYARQDRVCSPGESLSVKVVADLINSLNFTAVYCKDIHSGVGAALINNLRHIELNICAKKIATQFSRTNTVLVSPDAGANKKVFDFAKEFGFQHVVRADKVRDVLTGKIMETKVYSEHIGNKDMLILDDIFDGGRTFIELAKELRKITDGNIYLYITHGIFSKGLDVCEGVFDRVYCSNIMLDNWKRHNPGDVLIEV
jgi:ribose-phosphate pyrophosphokinase